MCRPLRAVRILLPLLLVVCALCTARIATANVVVALESVLGPIELELLDGVAPVVGTFSGDVGEFVPLP